MVVAFAYFIGHAVLVPGALVISRFRASAQTPSLRRAALAVGVVLGVVLVVCLVVVDALAIRVKRHGDRCVGACG